VANLVSSTIPNLIQGASLQPDASRDPSQGDEQINGMSSLTEGLRKREGTECIKKISNADLGDVYMHQILRDSGEKYLVIISKTSVKVFDLDGNEKSVYVAPNALNYLSSVSSAKTDIRAATIADYTFISNTKTSPALTGDTAPATARPTTHEALVWIKAANYGQTLKCNVNGTEATVTTAVAPVIVSSGTTTENRINTADLAEAVKTGLGSISGVTITRNKSVLHFTSNSPITIAAQDARANADITCITSEVQVFTELPTVAPEGYQIKILGDPSNAFDNYHVEFVPRTGAGTFGEGSWQECVSPGEKYKIDKDTMPLLLIRKPNGGFYLGPADGNTIYGKAVATVSMYPVVPMNAPDGIDNIGPEHITTDGSGRGLGIKRLTENLSTNNLDTITLYDVDDESGLDGHGYEVGDKIYITQNLLGVTSGTNPPLHIATVTAVSSSVIVKAPAWGERTCGDTDSAPNPSFIGFPIQDVFIYKNRLGFLADENIILSRAKSFFDFFPETVTTLLDSDPIDLQASNTKVSILRYAIPYQDELIIFSDQIQFRFNAAETILTPSTAVITVLTQFEVDINCRPLPVAGSIIFAQANGVWSSFREFSVKGAGSALVADASDLTSYVNSYIPSDVFKLTSNDTSSSWFTLSSKTGFEDRIYVYKYFYRNTGSGAERAQSSWSYWKLNGADKILQVLCVEETLYLLAQYGDDIWLEKMPVADRLSDVSPSPYPFLLDRKVSTTNETPTAIRVAAGTYNNATKQTTWTLPFTIVKETQAWSGFNTTTDGAVYLGTASSGTSITAEGDWSTSPIYFGEVFDFTYRFTKFKLYKEIGGGKAPGNVERTQVRYAKLRYHQTNYFEIHVKAERRDTAVYKFDGTILRVRDSVLGNVLPATGYDRDNDRFFEGVFRIPINSKGENCVVEIHNKTIHPCKFSTCEWVGLITSQARSIQ